MEKKEFAQKMIQHKQYDRKSGKYITTMVPQSKEHAEREKSINSHMSKFKPLSGKEQSDYQKKTGRGYNE